jgi:septal ring factor EnvC (AmiA/AmiB activator)
MDPNHQDATLLFEEETVSQVELVKIQKHIEVMDAMIERQKTEHDKSVGVLSRELEIATDQFKHLDKLVDALTKETVRLNEENKELKEKNKELEKENHRLRRLV